jgi:hypothetical protein
VRYGQREKEVERGEDEGEGTDGGVALGDAGGDESPLQEEGHEHGDEEGAHANGGKGEAEEFDEGGADVNLPAQHRGGPSGVDEVAGGGEGACHHDVGAVVADVHGDVGVADEFAEEDSEGAEKGRELKTAGELQMASCNDTCGVCGWFCVDRFDCVAACCSF